MKQQNPLPSAYIVGIIGTLFILLFMSIDSCSQNCWQCPESIDVLELPYTDEWCLTSGSDGSCPVINEYPYCDPFFGCWSCISNAHWYHFEINDGGGLLTMDVNSTLFNQSSDYVVTHYALFNGCPESGGQVLSRANNGCSGNDCWSFGGDYIQSSCWDEGCCQWTGAPFCYPYGPTSGSDGTYPDLDFDWDTGYPSWNFPNANYEIVFELPQGNYWIAVYPPWTCNPNTSVMHEGCIEVNFSGPNILSIPIEREGEACYDEYTDSVHRVQKLIDINMNLFFIIDGEKYNSLMQKIN